MRRDAERRSREYGQLTLLVSRADRARLKQLAADDAVCIADLVRGAINEYLETCGEPLLTELPKRGWKGHRC